MVAPERVPRRPARLRESLADSIPGAPDPAEATEIAHATARALVEGGRQGNRDSGLLGRLVRLVEDEGVEAVAELWSSSPAETLPGALWRLYVLREWARANPEQVAYHYRVGAPGTDVSEAIAGVVSAPEAADVLTAVDQILGGVFAGDVDVALDRAAAFVRVAATGMAAGADDNGPRSAATTRRALALLTTARELEAAARLAREGRLE